MPVFKGLFCHFLDQWVVLVGLNITSSPAVGVCMHLTYEFFVPRVSNQSKKQPMAQAGLKRIFVGIFTEDIWKNTCFLFFSLACQPPRKYKLAVAWGNLLLYFLRMNSNRAEKGRNKEFSTTEFLKPTPPEDSVIL